MSCFVPYPAPSLQQKKEQGLIDSSDKEILAEAERLEVRAMGPLILSELLFDENIREQIKKYKRHFLRVSLCMAFCLCFDSKPFYSKRLVLLQKFVCISDMFTAWHLTSYGWWYGTSSLCTFFFPSLLSFATMIKRLRSISWVASSVWWSSIRVSCCLVSPSFSKICMTPTCWKKTSSSLGLRRYRRTSAMEHCWFLILSYYVCTKLVLILIVPGLQKVCV